MKGRLEIEFEYESVGQVLEAMTSLDAISAIEVKRATTTFYDSEDKPAMKFTSVGEEPVG